jgi:hypothetical protein
MDLPERKRAFGRETNPEKAEKVGKKMKNAVFDKSIPAQFRIEAILFLMIRYAYSLGNSGRVL